MRVPQYVREVVEEIAFQARADQKIDRRSGVSQRLPITTLENVASNAERRALAANEPVAVPRVTDVYAALPAMTGKFELEYEGEMKGAETVARDLVRAAVANVFAASSEGLDTRVVVDWFDAGGTLQVGDTTPSTEVLRQAKKVKGLVELAARVAGEAERDLPPPATASAVDFVLEGLYAMKRIARNEERGYHAAETAARRPARPAETVFDERFPARPREGRRSTTTSPES